MTTTAPGVTVRQREARTGASIAVDEGTAFFVGITEKGSASAAILCRNMDQVEDATGDAVAAGLIHASADAFFREGGSRLYIGRVVGDSAAVSAVTMDDGATDSVRFEAISPGAWGDDLDVIVAGQNQVTVELDGEVVEESPATLTTKALIIAWAGNSSYIRAVDAGAGAFPDDGTGSLVGGSDDSGSAADDNWQAALDVLVKDLGPGQVAAPGRTSEVGQQQLLAHAEANNRVALIDPANTGTKGTLVSAANALHDDDNARFGAMFAPWVVIPGTTAGTTRTVPPSAVVAGIIANSDASGNNPNVAAAGDQGISVSAQELSQDSWIEEDRADLNDAGVNVIRQRAVTGTIQVYGFRSLADPVTDDAFIQFTASREFMSLAARGDQALEAFVFGEVDGKGVFFSKVEGALRSICLEDYNLGALYGDTPDEAFKVTCNESINPPAQIAQGEIHAVIEARVSPFAERVVLEIVKVANTEALV